MGSSLNGSLSWLNPTQVNATHAYDMVSLINGDLWIVGSQGADAVAWRSLDGGSSWAERLRVPPRNTTSGDFARFFGAAVPGGKLYVQAYDNVGGLQPSSKAFDGSGWSDGPSFATVSPIPRRSRKDATPTAPCTRPTGAGH